MDKILILILQFFVGVKIANYFGLEKYGIYTYAISIIAFSPLLLEIVNDRVIKQYYNTKNYEIVISSINMLKTILSIIIIIVITSKFFTEISNYLYIILILLALDNLFMNYTYGIKSYFEYELKSRLMVKTDNIVRVTYYFIQYVMIIMNYSLIMVIAVRVFGSLIRVFILENIYSKEYSKSLKLCIDIKLIKKIIKESKYLWISPISYILYAQLDKIMIGNMINIEEVGIYNIAFMLMNVTLIPIDAIRVSLYQYFWKNYDENYDEYIYKYKKITFFLTQFYIVISILSMVALPFIFPFVYSKEYNQAIQIFNAFSIAIIMRGNETFQYMHFTFKKLTKILFYKQILGLIFNLLLNYILIKKMGAIGAALSTSLTLVFTRLILDIFLKDTREIFKIQIEAFNIFQLKKMLK